MEQLRVLVRVLVNGRPFDVEVQERSRNAVRFVLAGREYHVEIPAGVLAPPNPLHSTTNTMRRSVAEANAGTGGAGAHAQLAVDGSFQVHAPLPGVVVQLHVQEGDVVGAGQVLLHVEAMKMHNAISAPAAGTIRAIHVDAGSEVTDGQLMVEIEPGPTT